MIYNKSKTYLLPLLSQEVYLDLKYFYFLQNTYIFDDMNKYKNCIYILHKTKFKDPQFTNYENKLLKNPYFLDLIDIEAEKSLYVLKFPKEYMHEYNMYIKGKYSQFGDDAKNLILSFWGEIHQNNVNAVTFLLKVKQILFRDGKLRRQMEKDLNVKLDKDAELGTSLEKESETFPLSEHNKSLIIR